MAHKEYQTAHSRPSYLQHHRLWLWIQEAAFSFLGKVIQNVKTLRLSRTVPSIKKRDFPITTEVSLHFYVADPLCSFSGFLLRFSCQFLSAPFAYSTLWGSPFILPRPVSLQVVEIALKVSPMLGAHMFQPLLPAVFRGIVDGEVSFTFASCSNLRWNCVKGGTCKNMFFIIHHIFNLKFVF